jgi:CheY-like chemotaxis protein
MPKLSRRTWQQVCERDSARNKAAPWRLEAIQKQKPHVLVFDLSMPYMDGFELLQKVRNLGPEMASLSANFRAGST